MPQTLSKELKFPRFILLLIIMYNFSPFYWIIILVFSQIINLISFIKSIDPGYFGYLRLCHTIFEKRISTVPSTTIIIIIIIHYIYIALFWVLRVLYIEEAGGGGGGTPQPPPVCSIHLDDVTAAILRQNAHHTPAYWWRGDSDAANLCVGMIRRLWWSEANGEICPGCWTYTPTLFRRTSWDF